MPAPPTPSAPATGMREAARAAAALRRPPEAVAERVRRALDDHAQVARLSKTFRALGDPNRSRLIYAL